MDYFIENTDRFEPIVENTDEKTDQTERLPLPGFRITEAMIRKRSCTCKKPRGLLSGDIWPDLINDAAGYLSKPLADI